MGFPQNLVFFFPCILIGLLGVRVMSHEQKKQQCLLLPYCWRTVGVIEVSLLFSFASFHGCSFSELLCLFAFSQSLPFAFCVACSSGLDRINATNSKNKPERDRLHLKRSYRASILWILEGLCVLKDSTKLHLPTELN